MWNIVKENDVQDTLKAPIRYIKALNKKQIYLTLILHF